MPWSFKDAVAYLNDTAPPGKSVYGLGRINHLLDLLDHPEDNFPCITIVGTNGKGSVLAFMDSLLRAHGLKVGCHIKPHLESVTERIRIDGFDCTPECFASSLEEVKKNVDSGWSRDDSPTYFELVFAAFLCAARSEKVDIALLETGLGGRLDAVNSVDAPLVVLTSVDLDHTEILGDSLASIAGEKLAVVRPGSVLVCRNNTREVMDTIREYALSGGIRLVIADDETKSKLPDGVEPGLSGPYQPMNASLALLAFKILAADILPGLFPGGIREEGIKTGLQRARLPGRWERICPDDRGPLWILDGAHNPSAMKIVLEEFKKITSGAGTLVIGMKKDKDIGSVIPQILDSGANIIFVKIPYFESHDPENLARMAAESIDNKDKFSQIQINWTDSISEGLELALELTPPEGLILVTGSLYLVGAVRSLFNELISISKVSS